MAAIESGRTADVVLDEMKVISSRRRRQKPSLHAGFGQSIPVGQFKLVKNLETCTFEPYDGSEDKPKFPKIISGYPGRTKLEEGTQALGEYLPYCQKKQEYFAQWICDYYKNNLKSNSNYSLPNFICFASRLGNTLTTPCKYHGKWDYHAARFLNSIFLWADPKFFKEYRTTKLGYGFAFEALMTGSDTATLPTELMNQKPLAVHERKLGKFSLLLVSDIDAEDDKSNWVELKCIDEVYLKKFMESKYPWNAALKWWSQLVVSDCQRVIISGHDREEFLTNSMVDLTLPEFEKMIGMSENNLSKCYVFLERLLGFVSKQFKQDDPKCAKQFLWTSFEDKSGKGSSEKPKRIYTESQKVKCVQAPAQEIPDWFNEMCKTLTQYGSNENV